MTSFPWPGPTRMEGSHFFTVQRMARRKHMSAASAMLVLSLAGTLCAQPSGTENGEWPAYAGDLRNFHYSPLTQINAGNFSKLEVAWRFKTDSLGTRPEFKLEG